MLFISKIDSRYANSTRDYENHFVKNVIAIIVSTRNMTTSEYEESPSCYSVVKVLARLPSNCCCKTLSGNIVNR